MSKADCKGIRICIKGKCVYPLKNHAIPCSKDVDCPGKLICEKRLCINPNQLKKKIKIDIAPVYPDTGRKSGRTIYEDLPIGNPTGYGMVKKSSLRGKRALNPKRKVEPLTPKAPPRTGVWPSYKSHTPKAPPRTGVWPSYKSHTPKAPPRTGVWPSYKSYTPKATPNTEVGPSRPPHGLKKRDGNAYVPPYAKTRSADWDLGPAMQRRRTNHWKAPVHAPSDKNESTLWNAHGTKLREGPSYKTNPLHHITTSPKKPAPRKPFFDLRPYESRKKSTTIVPTVKNSTLLKTSTTLTKKSLKTGVLLSLLPGFGVGLLYAGGNHRWAAIGAGVLDLTTLFLFIGAGTAENGGNALIGGFITFFISKAWQVVHSAMAINSRNDSVDKLRPRKRLALSLAPLIGAKRSPGAQFMLSYKF